VKELSKNQHIELIRALAEHAGGDFKVLSNKIPAMKVPQSNEWVKFTVPDIEGHMPLNAFAASKKLDVKIIDLPSEKDRLGGAAIVKDYTKATDVIKKVMNEYRMDVLEAEQLAKKVLSALSDSNVSTLPKRSESVLSRTLSERRSAETLISRLEISGVNLMWPEHHVLRGQNTLNSDFITVDNHVSIMSDKSWFTDALALAAKEHYQRPDMFILEAHIAAYQRNVGISLFSQDVDIADVSSDVMAFLKDTLGAYRDKGRVVFEQTPDLLYFPYKEIGSKERTLSPLDKLSELRELLGVPKKESFVQRTAIPQSTVEMAEKISIRSQLFSWRGIINHILEKNSDLPAKEINGKWTELVNHGANFTDTIEDLRETLSRVDNIYGPMLDRSMEMFKKDLGNIISKVKGESELMPLYQSLTNHLKQTLSAASTPTEKYVAIAELSIMLGDDEVSSMVAKFHQDGDLPAWEALSQKDDKHLPAVRTQFVEMPDAYTPPKRS
jgi:hypothetical protein